MEGDGKESRMYVGLRSVSESVKARSYVKGLNEFIKGAWPGIQTELVDTFKIAYNIMEKGNKVLFVDGDIRTDVFLGKYKLGKSAKGVLDYIKRPEKNEEIVCVTNHKNLSLIFTGINEDGVVTDDEIMIFKSLIDKYSKEYDYIVVDSDEDGTLAAFCGYAAIIAEKETYDEDELNNRVIQLEDKECNVLGVIIRE